MSAAPSTESGGDARSRPRLLVSVRNAAEATAALAGGATWIDLKDPTRGALGAVAAEDAHATAAALPPGVVLSAALGELGRDAALPARSLLHVPRVGFVKLGLAGRATAAASEIAAAAAAIVRQVRPLHDEVAAAGKQLVLAAYADASVAAAPPAAAVRNASCALGLRWLLIDTFDKRGRSLPELWPADQLRSFLAECRAAGLRTVVAGRLNESDLPRLPWDLLDVAGVRSAATTGERDAPIDAAAVRRLRRSLPPIAPVAKAPAHESVDFRAPRSSSW